MSQSTEKYTGLEMKKYFTRSLSGSVLDSVEWDQRTAEITDNKGAVVFKQEEIEAPVNWSDRAVNIVANKYFAGKESSPERENSIRAMINRVVGSIAKSGFDQGYFIDKESVESFAEDIKYLVVNQMYSPNSPAWFNVGIQKKPQVTACFINSIEDNMESILEFSTTEGKIFRHGSGSGSNMSNLRGSMELLSGGGTASGPVSFMQAYDAFAGVIKSGGKMRRAAILRVLKDSHPDIEKFIDCKVQVEEMIDTLVSSGKFGGRYDGEAYKLLPFQNANNTVRVSDEFMYKTLEKTDQPNWDLTFVNGGEIYKSINANKLLQKIAEAAHRCGDPGISFDDTINKWNTCKNSGRINAANPCHEYTFLDDTSCNLGSVNIIKFFKGKVFDHQAFSQAVRLITIFHNIVINEAGYPNEKIEKNTKDFRTIGLGLSNLGTTLMVLGFPYDSQEGRNIASSIMSLMTAMAYETSTYIAQFVHKFPAYDKNKEPMINVLKLHKSFNDEKLYEISPEKSLLVKDFDFKEAEKISLLPGNKIAEAIFNTASIVWENTLKRGRTYGFSNAYVTNNAPTGTIAFLMDCDSTGIEPNTALSIYKHLSGGGMVQLVNGSVSIALKNLGYTIEEITEINNFITEHGTIEGSILKEEHLPVFDCALKPLNGTRYISIDGHIDMLEALQPFQSGASSKTCNLPEEVSVEEIKEIYTRAWKKGLKAIAIYRDNSKQSQPLSTSKKDFRDEVEQTPESSIEQLLSNSTQAVNHSRKKLPKIRASRTHKFKIGSHEGYFTVGFYPDSGKIAEIFINISKEGSTISGLLDALATAVSIALQSGVPIEVFVEKYSYTKFEPSGYTNSEHEKLKYANSIIDHIFRTIEIEYLSNNSDFTTDNILENGIGLTKTYFGQKWVVTNNSDIVPEGVIKALGLSESNAEVTQPKAFVPFLIGPTCINCGNSTFRAGSCFTCSTCGQTTGCS